MSTPIFNLDDNCLDLILDFAAPASRELIDIDRKSSMSVESFATEFVPVDNTVIETFGKVCKRFKELVLRRKFARVAIRFSEEDFNELERLSKNAEQCEHVKKFSYMVHGFSSLSIPEFQKLLDEARMNNRRDAETIIQKMMQRTQEQDYLTDSKTDQIRIQAGLGAFKNLQQIRLMRIHDQIDRDWSSLVRAHNLPNETEQLRWARASEHAAKSLATAYLIAGSEATRISLRNLQTSILLSQTPHTVLSDLGQKLLSLEIQFDSRPSLDNDLLELSALFKQGFDAATSLKGLHLGFARPISTSFEAVFHDVYWSKLLYIGIGPWHLTSEDITGFLLRHRRTLKCVRLRGVLLKDGSHWLDVLRVLRRDMTRLKWVSLRSVGYSSDIPVHHYHQTEDDSDRDSLVMDDEDSRSSTENETEDEGEDDGENENESSWEGSTSDTQPETDDEDGESVQGESQHMSDDDDSESEAMNSFTLDDRLMLSHIASIPDAAPRVPRCNCDSGFAWEDLRNDNLQTPTRHLTKWWESWAIKGCKHDPN